MAETLLTLAECHAQLQHDLGAAAAPGLVTLKRWSTGGKLNQAKVIEAGKSRPRYKYRQVLAQARMLQRKGPGRSAPARRPEVQLAPSMANRATTGAGGESNGTSSLAQDRLQPAATTPAGAPVAVTQPALPDELLQAILAQQQQLMNALASVDAIRKTLMVRYDAEIHSLRERNAELARENNALRSATPSLDVARLHGALSRLGEKVDLLISQQDP